MGGDPGSLAGSTIPVLLRAPIADPGIGIYPPQETMSTRQENIPKMLYIGKRGDYMGK